jgi:hypothetical protein
MNDPPSPPETKPTVRITPEERARRKAAIGYVRVSMRLEGLTLSEFAEGLNRRYIEGEITSAEHSVAIRAHHGL